MRIEISYPAIIVAVLIAFVASAAYYIFMNKPYKKLLGEKPGKDGRHRVAMTPNRIVAELLRNFVLALVLAYAAALLNVTTALQALLLAIWLWIGFPVVMLAGSVIHENYPVKLAAIHAGDWLLKILVIIFIITIL